MNELKLVISNIKKNFKNAKELKITFIISILGMMFNNLAFIILWFNFGDIVGPINGWDKFDIIGLYAFNMTAYGVVSSFFYGVDSIPRYIATGNLDKFLLTPKNILFKIATSSISTSAIGDLVFGIICFVFYAFFANLTIVQILVALLFIFTTSIIMFAFLLFAMSLSFYFMDGENISIGVFQMFLSPSIYHGGAFSGALRIIFIFIVPSLLLGAVPVEVVKNLNLANCLFVISFSLLWLLVSIKFFYKSLKKYESNNFFGFSG